MARTYDNSVDALRTAADGISADLQHGFAAAKSGASAELRNLIADVEDLVARVANLKDADVVRVRGKVEAAIAAAKQGLVEGTDQLRRQARQAATTADDYVHDNPWQALGMAALVGAAVGFLVSRR